MAILDNVAPVKPCSWRKSRNPWITRDIRELMKKRDKLAKQLKTNNGNKAELIAEIKATKKQIKSRMRRARKDAGTEALSQQNSRPAWSFIRQATFTAKKSKEIAIDPKVLNEYFAKVVEPIRTMLLKPCSVAI